MEQVEQELRLSDIKMLVSLVNTTWISSVSESVWLFSPSTQIFRRPPLQPQILTHLDTVVTAKLFYTCQISQDKIKQSFRKLQYKLQQAPQYSYIIQANLVLLPTIQWPHLSVTLHCPQQLVDDITYQITMCEIRPEHKLQREQRKRLRDIESCQKCIELDRLSFSQHGRRVLMILRHIVWISQAQDGFPLEAMIVYVNSIDPKADRNLEDMMTEVVNFLIEIHEGSAIKDIMTGANLLTLNVDQMNLLRVNAQAYVPPAGLHVE